MDLFSITDLLNKGQPLDIKYTLRQRTDKNLICAKI